jgi:hypothetical protein
LPVRLRVGCHITGSRSIVDRCQRNVVQPMLAAVATTSKLSRRPACNEHRRKPKISIILCHHNPYDKLLLDLNCSPELVRLESCF